MTILSTSEKCLPWELLSLAEHGRRVERCSWSTTSVRLWTVANVRTSSVLSKRCYLNIVVVELFGGSSIPTAPADDDDNQASNSGDNEDAGSRSRASTHSDSNSEEEEDGILVDGFVQCQSPWRHWMKWRQLCSFMHLLMTSPHAD